MIRQALLALSRSPAAERALTRLPVSSGVVSRFVPGSDEPAALAAAHRLTAAGLKVTFDNLGEDVTDPADAKATVQAYEVLLRGLRELVDVPGAHGVRASGDAGDAAGVVAGGGSAVAEVSVKLSALGQALGRDGQQISLDNAYAVCAAARAAGTTVTIDAEDHTTTDRTLETVRTLREEFPETGTVLQACLYRTEADAADLAYAGSRIRLCKGAYSEPDSVAFGHRADIDRAYVRCLKVLMSGAGYPMVATHDPRLIAIADSLADRAGRSRDSFEFQMLYGIRPVEQTRLAAAGYQMRIYLPYGQDWYGYLMRRLAEKPANLNLLLSSLISKK